MTKFCKACLAKHDEETHAATNRVHEWFRDRVTKHLHDVADESRMEHLIDSTPSQGDELPATQSNAA
jgi:hypothetical protein